MITYSDDDSLDVIYEKLRRKRLSPSFYLQCIERFVEVGDVVDIEKDVAVDLEWKMYRDPILDYLHRLMSDPTVQSKVLSSKLAGRIFYESVSKFVLDCLHTQQFADQCVIAEQTEANKILEWSMQMKKDGWQALLNRIDEKHKEDGFDSEYLKKKFRYNGWKKPQNWERLKRDWLASLDEHSRKQVTKKIEAKETGVGGGINRLFDKIGEMTRNMGMSEADALQAWNMMDGQWTETEFEKHLSIVQIQNRYPEIGEVARKMGRLPDEDGRDRLCVQTGFKHKLDHSSGSDIEGVTIGRDLNALMPSELAQYMDSELESVFLRKWVTNRLQIFRYKSEITIPKVCAFRAFRHSFLGRTARARRDLDFARSMMAEQLAAGVTTVRTGGDMGYEMVALRDAVNAREMVGPRIVASGPTIGTPHDRRTSRRMLDASTLEAARDSCRRNIEAGVNCLSLSITADAGDDIDVSELSHVQMTERQIRAVCAEAHRRGLLVAARCLSSQAVHTALLAGVDIVEHGAALDRESLRLLRRNPLSLRGWSALVPMLFEAQTRATLPQSELGQSDAARANARLVCDGVAKGVRQADLADVAIGVGTDSGVTFMPQYAMWRELDALVRFGGLTRAQALHCATLQGARILGIERVTGSIEEGKYADLVMLEGNPLRHLRELESPTLVVARGVALWKPRPRRLPELDRMLDVI